MASHSITIETTETPKGTGYNAYCKRCRSMSETCMDAAAARNKFNGRECVEFKR